MKRLIIETMNVSTEFSAKLKTENKSVEHIHIFR